MGLGAVPSRWRGILDASRRWERQILDVLQGGGVSDTLQWGDFSSVQYRGRGKNLFNFSSTFLKHIYSMFCWYFGYFNFLVEGAEI